MSIIHMGKIYNNKLDFRFLRIKNLSDDNKIKN